MPGINKLVPFDAGINRLAEVVGPDGRRRPAILIPRAARTSQEAPSHRGKTYSNRTRATSVISVTRRHPASERKKRRVTSSCLISSSDTTGMKMRCNGADAVPLIFFERQPYAGKEKGYPRFKGFGVITGVKLVTQHSDNAASSFSNYEFDFAVLRMDYEGEPFDWSWINARRDKTLSDTAAASRAPRAWREWIRDGKTAFLACGARFSGAISRPPKRRCRPRDQDKRRSCGLCTTTTPTSPRRSTSSR